MNLVFVPPTLKEKLREHDRSLMTRGTPLDESQIFAMQSKQPLDFPGATRQIVGQKSLQNKTQDNCLSLHLMYAN